MDFTQTLIRTLQPPSSPSPNIQTVRTVSSTRTAGQLSRVQEERIHGLQQLAFSLHQCGESPLIRAVTDTVGTDGLQAADGLTMVQYGAVERRLELLVQMRGGKLPSKEI